MDQSLEELRAQRELVKKHLDWLDRQIESAQGEQPAEASTSQAPANATDEAKAETPAPAEQTSEATLFHLDEDRILAPSAPSDVMRAKIGCVALCGLGIGLFLFLLFGLPYLID